MSEEYLDRQNETEEYTECCDLYGEYCYPCNSEYPDAPVSGD